MENIKMYKRNADGDYVLDPLCYLAESKYSDLDEKEASHIFIIHKNTFVRQLCILENLVKNKERRLDNKSKQKLIDLFTNYKRHLLSLCRTTIEKTKLKILAQEFKLYSERFNALTT